MLPSGILSWLPVLHHRPVFEHESGQFLGRYFPRFDMPRLYLEAVEVFPVVLLISITCFFENLYPIQVNFYIIIMADFKVHDLLNPIFQGKTPACPQLIAFPLGCSLGGKVTEGRRIARPRSVVEPWLIPARCRSLLCVSKVIGLFIPCRNYCLISFSAFPRKR
jgi:hypothetical protein